MERMFTLRRMIASLLVVAAGATAATVYQVTDAVATGAGAPKAGDVAQGRYRARVFDTVRVTHVVYRTAVDHDGHSVDLKMNIFSPVGDNITHRPTVVFSHSGGFVQPQELEMTSYPQAYAERGYVAASFEYRLRPRMSWYDVRQRKDAARDAFEDATAALTYLRAHADDYGIDTSLLFVAGYSAGAVNAWDMATNAATAPWISGASTVAGFSNYAPRAGEPPVLAFRATTDNVVPNSLTNATCAAEHNAGNRCDVVSYHGQGHEVGWSQFNDVTQKTANYFADIIASR